MNQLIDLYKNASKSASSQVQTNGKSEQVQNRKKRLTPCACDFSNKITASVASITSSIYVYFPKTNVSWDCGFTCCNQQSVNGITGRLAQLPLQNSVQTLDFLFQSGAIPVVTGPADAKPWIALKADKPQSQTNAIYNWYSSPTDSGLEFEVTDYCPPDMCKTDTLNDMNKGGGIRLCFTNGMIKFMNEQKSDPNAILCECKVCLFLN